MRKEIYLFFSILLFQGCDLINPSENIPAFIEVPSASVSTSSQQGGPTQRISHIWLFQDNVNHGGYPLPARIPVPNPSEAFTLRAGIRENGFDADPRMYFAYNDEEFDLDLSPGQIAKLEPEFNYREDINFAFLEGFENSNNFGVEIDGNNLTRLDITDECSIDGIRSGVLEMTADNPILEVGSSSLLESLPRNGAGIFVELDYKNTVEFGVGLVGVLDTEEIPAVFITLRPKEDWNKIYLNITDFVLNSNFPSYRLYFVSTYNSQVEESLVFIDNIKVLHF